MVKKLLIALEEPLEVEKLQVAEKLSAKDIAYDTLYDKTIKSQEEKSKTVESSGSNFSNDSTSDSSSNTDETSDDMGDLNDDFSTDIDTDTNTETDAESTDDKKDEEKAEKDDKQTDSKDTEKESKEDKDAKAEETKPAQEDLKNLYTFIDSNVALEGEFFDSVKEHTGNAAGFVFDKTKQGIGTAARFTFDKSVELAKYLGYLGITYGPIALKKMYKGLLYVLFNMVKGLFVSIIAINKFVDRRINSFKNINKRIDNLSSKLDELESQQNIRELSDDRFFHNTNIINKIKINDSVDLSANITVANTFLNKVIKELDSGINNELNMINRLITIYSLGNNNMPYNLMQVIALHLPYKQGIIKGYEVNEELMESHYYPDILPGDLVFITNLPKKDINDLDELKTSYKLSNMFFGLNTENYVAVEKINYMNVNELRGLLSNLKILIDTCKEHEKHFMNIKKQKLKLRYNFKRYYEHLVTSKEKVSIKDSMAEFIQLKSHLIDTVYLSAAMNINDYSVTLINGYLSYIEKNIKEF